MQVDTWPRGQPGHLLKQFVRVLMSFVSHTAKLCPRSGPQTAKRILPDPFL